MIKIPLTQGKFALIDGEDFELISKYKWQTQKSGNTYYAITSIYKNNKRTTLRMHRQTKYIILTKMA